MFDFPVGGSMSLSVVRCRLSGGGLGLVILIDHVANCGISSCS